MKKRLSHLFVCFVTAFFCALPPLAASTVTTPDEAALRAALSGGSTVTFACDGTIVLANTLVISQDTVLDASGHNITISGNNQIRIFQVETNVTLSLKNIIIANGHAAGANGTNYSVVIWQPLHTDEYGTPGDPGFGGGLYNNGGTVHLFDCLFRSNSVVGGKGGLDNVTNNTHGGDGFGGGVANNRGTLVISNCIFSGNQAKGGEGGPGDPIPDAIGHTGGAGWGGALYNALGQVQIYRSSFSDNVANGGRGNAFDNGVVNSFAAGGLSQGGAIASQGGEIRMQDSSFTGNQALGLTGAQMSFEQGTSAYGGAVMNQTGIVAISRSTFERNSAYGGSGGTIGHGGEGLGGAVANFDGRIELVNCTGTGNNASGGASNGGHANGGNALGGAVYSASGVLCLTNTTFASNVVAGGPGASGTSWPGSPGAALGANLYVGNGTATLQNTILAYGIGGDNSYNSGTLIDAGANLSSDASGNFTSASSLNNIDPKLGPLMANGGPTKTMAPRSGSPAIDAGTSCGLATDQTGQQRTVDDPAIANAPGSDGTDIGAFEVVPGQIRRFQIVLSPSPPAAGTVSGGGAYEEGATLIAQASPNTGFEFANWTENGTEVSRSSSYSFTASADRTLVAHFADIQPPQIWISYPANGACIRTNYDYNDLLLGGTYADNAAVATVWSQWNGGVWSGVPTNQKTNWIKQLPMQRGQNVFRIYAEDTAGLCSATNEVNIQFVPLAPISLQIAGQGTVSGATNRQWLEAGSSYTLTANPSPGFLFAGWTGTMTSTENALQFTMQPNFLAIAGFVVDPQAPVLAISSPTNGTRIVTNDNRAVLQGTARDDIAIAGVFCQANDGPWTNAITANNWTNWTSNLPIQVGPNMLRAYARDSSGVCTATNEVRVQYAAGSPLTLQITGQGSVSGATNGQMLEWGSNYTVTATPAGGFIFTGWTGSQANTDNPWRFTMQSNFTVIAHFTADDLAPVISISSPTDGARIVSNLNLVQISGTAGDNFAVSVVRYQNPIWVGSAYPAKTTNGWTNWTFTVALSPGQNTLRAYSVDLAGHYSTNDIITVQYVPCGPLNLHIAAEASSGVQLEWEGFQGETYLIETSTNLVDWLPFRTVTMTNSMVRITDNETNDTSHRFYRAVKE